MPPGGSGSRRQSNIPRQDGESTHSLQGSTTNAQRESPRPSHRKLERTPLYLPDDSRASIEPLNDAEQNIELSRKPLAMVRPRQILKSITCTSIGGDEHNLDLDCNNLRESQSLDPFPSLLRRRIDITPKIPLINGNKQNSRSLDDGRLALISTNPNCDNCGMNDNNDNNPNKNKIPYKLLNNNCNGSTAGTDNSHCPLIPRQSSLNSPHDDNLMQQRKPWHSLENVAGVGSNNDDIQNKKNVNRGSIKSWIYRIFQRSASLRQVGVLQSGVRGITGFDELPSAPEHESIV